MTVRTTLSFTDRHHRFLAHKVEEGVFASTSAAVATAIEQMIEDDAARDTALKAMAEEIRARLAKPPEEFLDLEAAFAGARAGLAASER